MSAPRYLSEFITEIDVTCPACQKKSVVTSEGLHAHTARFACAHCGANKLWKRSSADVQYGGSAVGEKGLILGAPVDCYFRFPLWYATECCGGLLFAYNLAHLAFLREYISAKLRERTRGDTGWQNGSIQSRLPKWMLSSKNRSAILGKIAELEMKV